MTAPASIGALTLRLAAVIVAAQDRTALYNFPPAADRLARGEPVRFTRRGWRIFLLHRRAYRVPVDLRALETEVALNENLFRADEAPARAQATSPEGLTLAEFARHAGVDRRRLAASLVEIPPGPVPPLPSGTVPVRRIGETRRVFLVDLLGARAPEGVHSASRCDSEATSTVRGAAYDRQIDQLRAAGRTGH